MNEVDELVLNPHARVCLVGPEGNPSAIMVSAARRGVPRTVTTVEPSADFGVFPLLVRLARADEDLVLSLSDEQTAFLEQVGILVDADVVPASARFSPRLDRALLAAVPARERGDTLPDPASLRRSPDVAVQWTSAPPDAVPAHVHEALIACGLVLSTPILWVRDGRTDVWCPYEADPALAAAVERVGPGDSLEGPRDPVTLDLLLRAGILSRTAGAAAAGGRSPDAARSLGSELAPAFEERAHVIVPRLLPGLTVAAMRRYYEARVREGYFGLGDSLVERRFVAHNEPVARFFLGQLAAFVARVVGEAVKPSYVFFARYLPGAVLPRHVDREQCEYSLSFQVDCSPEPEDVSPWPLYLENAGSAEPRAVHLGLGDALLYCGRTQPHFRRRLPKGRSSTSLFFHFVREDYDGSLD